MGDLDRVCCVGRLGIGCGFVGGVSGGTCPKCGGMLLSMPAIEESKKKWRRQLMGKQVYDVTAIRTFLSDKKLSIQDVQSFFDNDEHHAGWTVEALEWVGESEEATNGKTE